MEIKRTNSYYGFINNYKPMYATRKQEQLDKRFKFKDEICRFADLVIVALLEGGYHTETKTITHGVINTRWGKDWGELSKPRTEFRFKSDDGTFYKLNKTQYDYCTYILENFKSMTEVEKYLSDENTRIIAEKERVKREAEEKQKREDEYIREQRKFQQWLNEECLKYSNTTFAKECSKIFEKQYPNSSMAVSLLNTAVAVLAKNILNERCRVELIQRLHNDNKASVKVFELYTGIKLPKNYKDRITVLQRITPDDYINIDSTI